MLPGCPACGGEADAEPTGSAFVETPPEIDGGHGPVPQRVPVYQCSQCGTEILPAG